MPTHEYCKFLLIILYDGRFSKDGDSKAGDVYSFGVVLLELLTGKKPIDSTLPNGMDLVSWATPHLTSEQGNLVRWLTPQLISEEGLQMIVDDRLEKDYPLVAVKMVIKSYKFQIINWDCVFSMH